MKKIAIFAKVHDPRCQGVAEELVAWLGERGLVPLVEAHLAMAYSKAGDTAQAKKELRRALELDPKFAGAEDAEATLQSYR